MANMYICNLAQMSVDGQVAEKIGMLSKAGALIAAEIDRLQFVPKAKSPWISVKDALPEHGQRVIARYTGVYNDRVVTFWIDGGNNPHFGSINEPDSKGSQPATHWMPIPEVVS